MSHLYAVPTTATQGVQHQGCGVNEISPSKMNALRALLGLPEGTNDGDLRRLATSPELLEYLGRTDPAQYNAIEQLFGFETRKCMIGEHTANTLARVIGNALDNPVGRGPAND